MATLYWCDECSKHHAHRCAEIESLTKQRDEEKAAREKAEGERDALETRRLEGVVAAREIIVPCPKCRGVGSVGYQDTSTYRRGGMAGQMATTDVCASCWGSGDAEKPWPSWVAAAEKREQEALAQVAVLVEALNHSEAAAHSMLAYESPKHTDDCSGCEVERLLANLLPAARKWLEEREAEHKAIADAKRELDLAIVRLDRGAEFCSLADVAEPMRNALAALDARKAGE